MNGLVGLVGVDADGVPVEREACLPAITLVGRDVEAVQEADRVDAGGGQELYGAAGLTVVASFGLFDVVLGFGVGGVRSGTGDFGGQCVLACLSGEGAGVGQGAVGAGCQVFLLLDALFGAGDVVLQARRPVAALLQQVGGQLALLRGCAERFVGLAAVAHRVQLGGRVGHSPLRVIAGCLEAVLALGQLVLPGEDVQQAAGVVQFPECVGLGQVGACLVPLFDRGQGSVLFDGGVLVLCCQVGEAGHLACEVSADVLVGFEQVGPAGQVDQGCSDAGGGEQPSLQFQE